MVRNFHSVHFGTIQVEPQSVLTFPAGVPGFEDLRGFTMLEHPDQPALIFLQSLDRPELCFLTMPVEALRPNYELAIDSDDLELIGAAGAADSELRGLAVLSLVEAEPPTANLLAPIVICRATRRAVQAIRPDNRYSLREPILCS